MFSSLKTLYKLCKVKTVIANVPATPKIICKNNEYSTYYTQVHGNYKKNLRRTYYSRRILELKYLVDRLFYQLNKCYSGIPMLSIVYVTDVCRVESLICELHSIFRIWPEQVFFDPFNC